MPQVYHTIADSDSANSRLKIQNSACCSAYSNQFFFHVRTMRILRKSNKLMQFSNTVRRDLRRCDHPTFGTQISWLLICLCQCDRVAQKNKSISSIFFDEKTHVHFLARQEFITVYKILPSSPIVRTYILYCIYFHHYESHTSVGWLTNCNYVYYMLYPQFILKQWDPDRRIVNNTHWLCGLLLRAYTAVHLLI